MRDETDKLLTTQLGETLLSSMLGLFAQRLREMPSADALAVLQQVESGQARLLFQLEASGKGARLHAALVSGDGGTYAELMTLELSPQMDPQGDAATHLEPVQMLGALYLALGDTSMPGAMPAEIRAWARASIREAVARGDSLDAAMGFKGAGKRSLAATLDLQNRDTHLLAALRFVALDDQVSEWGRCQRLAQGIKEFSRCKWPENWGRAEPPAEWAEWERQVFLAARAAPGSTKADPKLPRSANQLHNIAKSNPGFSLSDSPSTVLANFRKH